MNEREALENIKEICKNSKRLTCTNNGCCQVSTCEQIEKVIDQALAPQECDLNEFYNKCAWHCGSWTKDKNTLYCSPQCENSAMRYNKEFGNKPPFIKYPDGNKQLHSQEKTFTLGEVKAILKQCNNEFNTMYDPNCEYFKGSDEFYEYTLNEFEKETK